MIWVLTSIIAALFILLVWRENYHDRERKDLYNRFMARDLNEYIGTQTRKPPKSGNFVKAGLKRSLNEMGKIEGD